MASNSGFRASQVVAKQCLCTYKVSFVGENFPQAPHICLLCSQSITSATLRFIARGPRSLIHSIKKEAGRICDAVCHILTRFIFFSFTSIRFIPFRLITSDLIDIGLRDLVVHHFFFRSLVILIEFSFLCKNFSKLV